MSEILHNESECRFELKVDGYLAYVKYAIEGCDIDVKRTFVPKEIGGRGIAAKLVEATYKYGESIGLKPKATCSYAVVWLERNRR